MCPTATSKLAVATPWRCAIEPSTTCITAAPLAVSVRPTPRAPSANVKVRRRPGSSTATSRATANAAANDGAFASTSSTRHTVGDRLRWLSSASTASRCVGGTDCADRADRTGRTDDGGAPIAPAAAAAAVDVPGVLPRPPRRMWRRTSWR